MKKLWLLLFIILSFLSCKKTSKEEIKTESNYTIALHYISSYPKYTLFTEALRRIDLESKLLGTQFSILVPNDGVFQQFIHNKGYGNIEDIPQSILEKIVLNHIMDSKLQIPSYYNPGQLTNLKSMANVLASNGDYHKLSLLLEKDQDNNFTINRSRLVKELVTGNMFSVFSIEEPIDLLKLESVVELQRFYKDVIKDNSSFDIINKLKNSEQSTILFLSDDKVDDFLSLMSDQDMINSEELFNHIYIPNFNIHRHDFFSPINIDPPIDSLAIKMNTLNSNKIALKSFRLIHPQIGRSLKLDFRGNLPLEFYSDYPGIAISYEGKILYSIEKDIYVTDNGILLLLNNFKTTGN
ncbi:MAG: fasciclin domain-containing protein [Hyphomicrobiales bacterium]